MDAEQARRAISTEPAYSGRHEGVVAPLPLAGHGMRGETESGKKEAGMSRMALCVRFTLRGGADEAFDELVRQAAAAVLEHEPGALVYACSEVEGAPNQRLFFELYADRAAFDEHGCQPHVRHFLSESKKYAERTEIDRLRPYAGKYLFI
ncbi:putative quinol monooxygenase [Streptomyces carpinensis]|uniref:Antibiotic biosynthesis monooxygenase n=1 Tax=Streptomyces carpinensis TaxID=66369 RepID=A0ABV1W6W5_9ACTN|nr:antibiotic biosynthesis monooxygenase [Streptomyces carpinensis]